MLVNRNTRNGKRKALNLIQLSASISSKNDTPQQSTKLSQDNTVELKPSQDKLQVLSAPSTSNETLNITSRVLKETVDKDHADEIVESPPKKQRLQGGDEHPQSLSSSNKVDAVLKDSNLDCQECIRRKKEDEIKLMISDEAPLAYWKQLAEQRRDALDQALKENETLHDQIEVLETENTELKVMAEHAKQLAEILQGLNDSEEIE